MRPRLIIHSLTRTTRNDEFETLSFDSGVNVIVGAQNSGKSTWLKMLDFLMFETDAVKVRFDDIIVEKYKSISAIMTVGDRDLNFAKAWDEEGSRSVTTIDGERISATDAEALFFDLLQIPLLRYPQGSLVSERTWPTLGWRSLYRHIYRRQDFWHELVPKQPESEQHAVLLQFLGLAEILFSDDLAKLADKRRELIRAEGQKDFFLHLVNQAAPNLFPEEELQVGLTEASIGIAKARLDAEIDQLVDARTNEFERIQKQIDHGKRDLQALMDRRTAALAARAREKTALDGIKGRLNELESYSATLQQETSRLARAEVAADVFSGLRITHCPACDQSVEGRRSHPSRCFLCEQPTPPDEGSLAAGTRRLKFERDQVAAELEEAKELIATAVAEVWNRERELDLAQRDLDSVEVALRPFQAQASQLLPESVALIDQQVGALGARKQALNRLYEPLKTRDAYTHQIDQLRREISQLEARTAENEENASFEEASDWLSEGFTTYLNQLKAMDSNTWTKSGAVTVRVIDRKTTFYIGSKPAKPQLGGTLTLYFSFAYHYALLGLMRRPRTHFPGLAVLDTFPDIAVGPGLRDPLGLVMKPFEELAANPDVGPVQIILTARDFPFSPAVRTIRLTEVWR